MPTFTIKTTYRLPVYRHGAYQADNVGDACRLAIEDDEWSDAKQDDQSAGQTYISGIWRGSDAAYRGTALPVPSEHCETIQRKADHFEALLGVLKILAHRTSPEASHRGYWLSRAQAVIAKAEAILAGEPDPKG